MRSLSTILVSVLATSLAGCGSSTSPTSTTDLGNSYSLSGSVPAAVNGAPQSHAHNFLLDAQYSVSVTLKTASETMLDGSALSTVSMGVGLGTLVDGVCTIVPGASVTTPAGTAVQLVWTLPAGTDCVQVSDATIQEGPVAYTLTVTYK